MMRDFDQHDKLLSLQLEFNVRSFPSSRFWRWLPRSHALRKLRLSLHRTLGAELIEGAQIEEQPRKDGTGVDSILEEFSSLVWCERML